MTIYSQMLLADESSDAAFHSQYCRNLFYTLWVGLQQPTLVTFCVHVQHISREFY